MLDPYHFMQVVESGTEHGASMEELPITRRVDALRVQVPYLTKLRMLLYFANCKKKGKRNEAFSLLKATISDLLDCVLEQQAVCDDSKESGNHRMLLYFANCKKKGKRNEAFSLLKATISDLLDCVLEQQAVCDDSKESGNHR
ncbi:hypothetical protein TREES_T100007488 [Tupaia chinensis]|uniref:Uncharacterized protein n=1 Tax=Tupaia chinensis TaxID=246437 RepID=L9KYP9_TUPCH|nr:hypothetical protein TREES_T100007488 [Tupaia chinensis]